MSKKNNDASEDMPHRLNLGDEVERLKVERGLEVELSDGSTITIPPPELWPDESRAIFKDKDKTDRDLAIVLWGEDGWERFVADGGTESLFAHLLAKRYQLTTGESSASSSS